jgi:hypothetical protein
MAEELEWRMHNQNQAGDLDTWLSLTVNFSAWGSFPPWEAPKLYEIIYKDPSNSKLHELLDFITHDALQEAFKYSSPLWIPKPVMLTSLT